MDCVSGPLKSLESSVLKASVININSLRLALFALSGDLHTVRRPNVWGWRQFSTGSARTIITNRAVSSVCVSFGAGAVNHTRLGFCFWFHTSEQMVTLHQPKQKLTSTRVWHMPSSLMRRNDLIWPQLVVLSVLRQTLRMLELTKISIRSSPYLRKLIFTN